MISESEYQQLAAAFPFVEAISQDARETLMSSGVRVALPKDQRAFGVGSVCESFLLVTEGSVCVATSLEDRRLLLYRVCRGESCILTTSCIMGGEKYPADGIAESDTVAVAIPERAFHKLLQQAPPFREFVFSTFSSRIANFVRLLQEVAFKKLDRRIAKHLLGLQTESVTHQAIASELGTVREIVSRILKSFESDGVLTLSRNRITILDRNRLEAIAND